MRRIVEKSSTTKNFVFGSAIQHSSETLIITGTIGIPTSNLIAKSDLKKLITSKAPKTSLCVTGRDFPEEFLPFADIATNMTKIRHHFDDKYLANKGIDY